MVGLQAGEWHLVAGHRLAGIRQILVERLRAPDDVCALHRRRIIVVRLGTGLPADDSCKRGPEHVLAGLDRVTGLAFPEDEASGDGITAWSALRSGGDRRR